MTRRDSDGVDPSRLAVHELTADLAHMEKPSLIVALSRACIQLVPGVGGAIDVLLGWVTESHRYRLRQTLDEVSRSTGPETLLSRVEESPELAAMLTGALDAAMRTGHEGKRRLMGKLISQAVLDDEQLDESTLFVQALSRLEGPHFRALEALHRANAEAGAERIREERDEAESVRIHGSSMNVQPATPAAVIIEERMAGFPFAIAAGLVREGLLVGVSGFGGGTPSKWRQHEITEFGESVLTHLRDAEME